MISNAQIQSNLLTQDTPKKLVLLIHGIRTRAMWQDRIANQLMNSNNTIVVSIGYEYFNVFEFLCPLFTRQHAVEQVKRRIEIAINAHPDHDLIIIAHSFGTYCVTKILDDSPFIKPKSIIFCGSVVNTNFKWEKLPQQPNILNECGTKDIWPCIARSCTWGFGSSGTFGFKTPGINDRFHAIKHSDYFENSFSKKFWEPFISNGEIIRPDEQVTQSEPPWFMSLLALRLFWIPWIGIIGCGILISLLIVFTNKPINFKATPPPFVQEEGQKEKPPGGREINPNLVIPHEIKKIINPKSEEIKSYNIVNIFSIIRDWSNEAANKIINSEPETATATDAAVNVSAPITATAPDTHKPEAPIATIAADGTVVTGTAEPGSTVVIADARENELGKAVVANDGNYSISLSPALTNGEVVTATATDAAGNVSAPTTAIAPASNITDDSGNTNGTEPVTSNSSDIH